MPFSPPVTSTDPSARVVASWDQRPSFIEGSVTQDGEDELRYELDGKRVQVSSRCELCDEFGIDQGR